MTQSSNVNSPDVVDRESAVRFIHWCIEQLSFGFHPDTPFDDYRTGEDQPFFSDEIARALDLRMEAAFMFCDPYQVGMEEFERLKRELS